MPFPINLPGIFFKVYISIVKRKIPGGALMKKCGSADKVQDPWLVWNNIWANGVAVYFSVTQVVNQSLEVKQDEKEIVQNKGIKDDHRTKSEKVLM